MTFLNCNAEGTTGYTAVTGGSSVAMVHAHENDNIGFYADMDSACPRGFFIYMPLDDGEFVTEICRRYAVAAGNWISTCLVVRYPPFAFCCTIVFVTYITIVVHYEQR